MSYLWKEQKLKFIVTADLHIKDKCPENRKGDYYGHVLNKFEQILKITKEENAILLIAGDFFDSPTVPYEVVKGVLSIIKKYEVPIYVIPGQHDLRYHSSGLNNTPLGLLHETGYTCDLTLPKFTIKGFIGAAWGEEPKAKANILVLHKMVTEEGPLWYGQEYFISAKELLKKYPWARIIISGDNHKPHVVEYLGRYQINCGSMMRSSKDQINYEPAIWGIDIIEGNLSSKIKIEKIPLKIKSPEKVFDFDKIQKDDMKKELKEEAQKRIENFINTLPKTELEKPNFKNSLQIVMKSMNPKDKIKNIVNSIMEKCEG